MEFIADAMLGSLAKWLRFLGLDVLYYPDIDDKQIIKIAREQDRVILTRDTCLTKHRGAQNAILIKSNGVSQQLAEIRGKIDFRDAEPEGRCVTCNGILARVSQKIEVRELVPDFIYHGIEDFVKCSNCEKVYWRGTHYTQFMKQIRETAEISIED